MTKKKEKTVVMIPTYNERENIKELIEEILNLKIDGDLEIVVADDNSPDGTSGIVREISSKDKRVHLLLREKRRGRGAGGIDGFKKALELNPDYIIEMDGDFSHKPKYIPELIRHCKKCDIVIGSRFVKGGKDSDRNLIRKFITFFVRNFIRWLFKVPVKDVSSGYRCFKREVLEKIDLEDLISIGPSIVLEILYKAYLMNFTICEIPIVFIDRKKGKTKLNFITLLETLVMALKFRKYIPSRIQANQ